MRTALGEKGKPREEKLMKSLGGSLGILVTILASMTTLYHLTFILGLFQNVNIFIPAATHYAISLGLILSLVFLVYPARAGQPRTKVPWYDVLFCVGALVSCSYHVFFHDLVTEHILGVSLQTTGIEKILGIILFIELMEGTRRTIGMATPILAGIFVLYAFICGTLPGFLFARPIDLSQAILGFYLGSNGVFSVPMQMYSTIIFAFVAFSCLLQVSGAGKFLVDLALSAAGSFRGGPAKVAIVSSAFFGTMSGSTAANVAATGSVTIPLMKSIGYRPAFAGAVEAVSSNGGQIMPPVMGIVAFMMAEITGTPYLQVCKAALLPAILYYITLFVAVDLEAARIGLKGLAPESKPRLRRVMKENWHYLIPIAFLVFCLSAIMIAPEIAALWAAGAVVVVSMFSRKSRMGPKEIIKGLELTARTLLVIGPVCGLIGVIIGVMSVSGIGILMSSGLLHLAGGIKALLLVLAALISFLMGMGMGGIIIYMTLSALVAPVLVDMGVHVMAAHLFILYWGMVSIITPPVAIGAFVAAGIAGSKPWETGWTATRLGIATFIIPFIFVYNPVLLLEGAPLEIIQAVITSLIGAFLLGIAVIGYLFRPLNWRQRSLVFVSSLLLIVPGWTTDLLGLCLCIIALSSQINLQRLQRMTKVKYLGG
jgi:TRAP transporter 4TM/12TM fusion protein